MSTLTDLYITILLMLLVRLPGIWNVVNRAFSSTNSCQSMLQMLSLKAKSSQTVLIAKFVVS